MRFYTFLFAFLLISSFLSAQQERDYCVTVNADTVYGKVKVNKVDFNLTKFKKTGEDYQSLSNEIVRFYDAASNESYVRQKIGKDSSSFYAEKISGYVNLYSSPVNYYVVRQGKYVELLRDKKLSMGQYGSSATALKNFLNECVTIGEKEVIEIFSEHEIVLVRLYNLVRTYNQCVDPKANKVEARKKSVLSVEFMAIAGVGKMDPYVSKGDVFNYAYLENSAYAQFQGRVKVGYSPRKNRWIFAAAYSWSPYHSKGSDSRLGTVDLFLFKFTESWNFSADFIDLSFGFEYNIFLSSRFSLYPMLGTSIVMTDIKKFHVEQVRGSESGTIIATNDYYLSNDNLRDFVPSFYYGLGMGYKITDRITSVFEFTQYTPTTIKFYTDSDSLAPELEIKRNSFRIGLSYALTKD